LGIAIYASKDRLENHLHDLVCAGQFPLGTAQHGIATNWGRAYQRYILVTVHRHRGSHPKTAETGPTGRPRRGATAQCNDGSYSYSQHHQGTWSHHGGVRVFSGNGVSVTDPARHERRSRWPRAVGTQRSADDAD
jgi:hypothetical protein